MNTVTSLRPPFLVIMLSVAIVMAPFRAPAFEQGIHDDITVVGIATVSVKPPDPSPTLRVSGEQVESYGTAVANVDYWTVPYATNHFDDEQLVGTSRQIESWTGAAIESLTTTGSWSPLLEGFAVTTWIAMSLHAIQDFYSHSNFVTLHGAKTLREPYGIRLGFDVFPENPLPDAKFCFDDNPGKLLAVTSLTTGYFNPLEGRNKYLGCDCTVSPSVPSGKCQHGAGFPEVVQEPSLFCPSGVEYLSVAHGDEVAANCHLDCSGINKDEPCVHSSSESCRPFSCFHMQDEHSFARIAAEKATKEYFDLLIARVRSQNPLGVCRLFGLPESDCGLCGDSSTDGLEQCDDGNTTPEDGCSATCTEESGWDCTGTPSLCHEICGDNMKVGTEECDDGNTDPLDACNNDCKTNDCGDGIRNGAPREECDGGDGTCSQGEVCSNYCRCAPEGVRIASMLGEWRFTPDVSCAAERPDYSPCNWPTFDGFVMNLTEETSAIPDPYRCPDDPTVYWRVPSGTLNLNPLGRTGIYIEYLSYCQTWGDIAWGMSYHGPAGHSGFLVWLAGGFVTNPTYTKLEAVQDLDPGNPYAGSCYACYLGSMTRVADAPFFSK